MHRVILCAAAALLAFGVGAAPAAAADRDTCDKGKSDKVIAACSRLIKRNPNDAIAYINRGAAFANKGDYHRVIADYSQAIRLDPKDALEHDAIR